MVLHSVFEDGAGERNPRLQAIASRCARLADTGAFTPAAASSELGVVLSGRAQAISSGCEPVAPRPFVQPDAGRYVIEPPSPVASPSARRFRGPTPFHRLSVFDSPTAFACLRFVLAALLLTAAGLKAYQLATEPILGTGLLHWRPMLIGAVEFELFLALWLISGAYPRVLWWTTLVCFIAFTQITLYRGITGEASCGCFGRVEINPWWMFLVDSAVVGSLLCFRPAARSQFKRVRTDWRGLVIILLLTLVIGVPAGAAVVHYAPVVLRLGDDPTGGTSFILLEPARWVGHVFPIFSQVDVGPQLRDGRWAVLFFRHDCPMCQEELRNVGQRAASFMGNVRGYHICLIEVPPFRHIRERPTDSGDRIVLGRLNANQEWFVEVPAWIQLADTVVVSVAEGKHDVIAGGIR